MQHQRRAVRASASKVDATDAMKAKAAVNVVTALSGPTATTVAVSAVATGLTPLPATKARPPHGRFLRTAWTLNPGPWQQPWTTPRMRRV